MRICVNGSLMRDLALNENMQKAGAIFDHEDLTAPIYRLWSINDMHPGMIRDEEKGAAISVELWQVNAVGLVSILEQEPPGLVIGRVQLRDGSEALGILAEPYLVRDQLEITAYGGWRAYISRRGFRSPS